MIDTKIKKNFIITSISSLKNSFKEARVFGKYIKEKQIYIPVERYKMIVSFGKGQNNVAVKHYINPLFTLLYFLFIGQFFT